MITGKPRRIALVGVGRLQLGLIAPAFSKMGFELVAVSLRGGHATRRLSKDRLYRISHSIDSDVYEQVRVQHVVHLEEFSADSPRLAEIARCEVINFALGGAPDAVRAAGRLLIEVQKIRLQSGIREMCLVMCSDNPAGASFGVDRIRDNFMDQTIDEPHAQRLRIWDHAGCHLRFVRTLADRICTERILEGDAPLRVICEEHKCLILDKEFDEYRGVRFKIPDHSGIHVLSPIEDYRRQKFCALSMAHAIACYLGFVSERRHIRDAMESPEIAEAVGRALQSVDAALVAGGEGRSSLWDQETTSKRLRNEHIEDGIARVARDVPRKLLLDDRLLGPLLMIYERTFTVSEPLLSTIGAALVYATRYESPHESGEYDEKTHALGIKIRRDGVEPTVNALLGGPGAMGSRMEYVGRLLVERFNQIDQHLLRAGR